MLPRRCWSLVAVPLLFVLSLIVLHFSSWSLCSHCLLTLHTYTHSHTHTNTIQQTHKRTHTKTQTYTHTQYKQTHTHTHTHIQPTTVQLSGWLRHRRKLNSSFAFAVLADGHGQTQVVYDPRTHEALHRAPLESQIRVRGAVRARPADATNPAMSSGNVCLSSVLSPSSPSSPSSDISSPVFSLLSSVCPRSRTRYPP
jgi:OB-fold nucleic acid binding domain